MENKLIEDEEEVDDVDEESETQENEVVLVKRSMTENAKAHGIVMRYGPKSWQYRVFDEMAKQGYEFNPTFEPYIETILVKIGVQLGVLAKDGTKVKVVK